jgi:hypothetical protein
MSEPQASQGKRWSWVVIAVRPLGSLYPSGYANLCNTRRGVVASGADQYGDPPVQRNLKGRV